MVTKNRFKMLIHVWRNGLRNLCTLQNICGRISNIPQEVSRLKVYKKRTWTFFFKIVINNKHIFCEACKEGYYGINYKLKCCFPSYELNCQIECNCQKLCPCKRMFAFVKRLTMNQSLYLLIYIKYFKFDSHSKQYFFFLD